jgi:hypothetical protein
MRLKLWYRNRYMWVFFSVNCTIVLLFNCKIATQRYRSFWFDSAGVVLNRRSLIYKRANPPGLSFILGMFTKKGSDEINWVIKIKDAGVV